MFTSTIASRPVTDKSPLSVTAPMTGFQTVIILFANVWKCITILLVQTLCSKQRHNNARAQAISTVVTEAELENHCGRVCSVS